jgi:cytochrome P450
MLPLLRGRLALPLTLKYPYLAIIRRRGYAELLHSFTALLNAMHFHELALIALGLLAIVTIKSIYDAVKHPLRSVPGPRLARFTRLWYFRTIWTGQAHVDIMRLHRENAPPGKHYAPIVRLGPNMYSISSPDKAVYGISSKMPKSLWYEGWKHPSPERWTLFTERDITRHNQTRKKFQAMYSLSSLLHYETYVDQVQEVMVAALDRLADSAATATDMHHWLQCYAFDVIGTITFGQRFGFLDEGKDINDCMRSLDASMVYSTLVGVFHWAHPLLFSLLQRLPGSGAAGRSYLMQFVSQKIADRERSENSKVAGVEEQIDMKPVEDSYGPRDFLDIVLDAERKGQKDMTKYNVFMMGMSNVIAGSDTTAVSLSSVLWHLAANPLALTTLRRELEECIENGGATRDNVPFKEAQKLPFLQGCIKEGLRLCSATGLPLWRVVPAGGAKIMDQYFPAGTEVGINTWVAHYDADVWGDDAAAFRPRRWLAKENDEDILRRQEEHFMPVCYAVHILT